MKNTAYFILIAFTFMSLKCDPAAVLTALPPETHVGKNTFGCKIDNKFFESTGPGDLKMFTAGIFANRWGINLKLMGSIDFLIDSFTFEPKQYRIKKGTNYDNSNNVTYWFKGQDRNKDAKNYTITNSDKGFVFFTKVDTINYIYSGTFEFTATDSLGNKINITDGRFDIKKY